MNSNNSRRSFLKKSLLAVGATPFAAQLLTSKAFADGHGKKKYVLLEESDPQGKALGYYKDATKVDTKKFSKRATPAAKKDQWCDTCQLYKKVGEEGGKEIGTCTLFMAPKLRHVYAKGWCNSWVKKA